MIFGIELVADSAGHRISSLNLEEIANEFSSCFKKKPKKQVWHLGYTMVVTRKVKVPKRDFGDEPAPPAAPEAAEAVVEKVVPDVDESNDENVGDLSNLDEVPADDTIEESIENIKTEVEGEDGSGKRVSKPSFKVKYAGQKLSGNLSPFDADFCFFNNEI